MHLHSLVAMTVIVQFVCDLQVKRLRWFRKQREHHIGTVARRINSKQILLSIINFTLYYHAPYYLEWPPQLCVILFMYLYMFGKGRHSNCRVFPYTRSYIQSHGLPTWGTKVMINGVLKVDERRASLIQSLWRVSVKCSHWKSHRWSPLTRLRPLNPSFRLDFVQVSLNFLTAHVTRGSFRLPQMGVSRIQRMGVCAQSSV